MDFAPYQSSPPEHERALSPQNTTSASPRTSFDAARNVFSRTSKASPPPLHHPQPQRAWSGDGVRSPPGEYQSPGPDAGAGTNGGGSAGLMGGSLGDYISMIGAREGMVSEFDTSFGIRLDYEACLAYLACPPLGAIILLILERNSDFVRFHAWQSSLLFTMIFIIHLIFSWSTVVSWLLLLGDFALVVLLVMRTYRDADTLDRYELPIVGSIASRILDDE